MFALYDFKFFYLCKECIHDFQRLLRNHLASLSFFRKGNKQHCFFERKGTGSCRMRLRSVQSPMFPCNTPDFPSWILRLVSRRSSFYLYFLIWSINWHKRLRIYFEFSSEGSGEFDTIYFVNVYIFVYCPSKCYTPSPLGMECSVCFLFKVCFISRFILFGLNFCNFLLYLI